MEQTIASRYVDVLWDLARQDLPEDIIEEVKKCLIDYMGCTYMGASLLFEENSKVLDLSSHAGSCSVLGMDRKTDVYTAGMLNGFDAHVMELDDGHRFGMLHLGAVIISALLAVCQDRGLSGKEFLRGIVIGYEATIRLAMAIQPGHKRKGFHATATCGTIGAAIGIAAALHYDKKQWMTVLTGAATSSAGLLELMDDASLMKPYNISQAVVSAISAAYFGISGWNGPEDVLGGERGFLKLMANEVDEASLFKADDYEIRKIYRKPYAACRHAHAPIEATLDLRNRYSIDPESVIGIVVQTYDLAVKGHDHQQIPNSASARMSIPYAVAAALCFNEVGYEQYDDAHINDRQLQDLIGKIRVKADPELSALVPKQRAAIVTIETKQGSWCSRVDHPLGEPENPMSATQLEQKYQSLLKATGRDERYRRELLDSIYNIEKDMNGFISKL